MYRVQLSWTVKACVSHFVDKDNKSNGFGKSYLLIARIWTKWTFSSYLFTARITELCFTDPSVHHYLHTHCVPILPKPKDPLYSSYFWCSSWKMHLLIYQTIDIIF